AGFSIVTRPGPSPPLNHAAGLNGCRRAWIPSLSVLSLSDSTPS
ncbi:hypothetical protein A2U01_0060836, partial [Trifolium medium]|nr:hypothetical protein [Trifolium medium]